MQMPASALEDVDASVLDLLRELAERLDLAAGKRRIEVTYADGDAVALHFHGQTPLAQLRCRCRRHAWAPSCPVHPPSSVSS